MTASTVTVGDERALTTGDPGCEAARQAVRSITPLVDWWPMTESAGLSMVLSMAPPTQWGFAFRRPQLTFGRRQFEQVSSVAVAWLLVEAVFAVVGALIGGSIALMSSFFVRRSEERQFWMSRLADACTEIYRADVEYERHCVERLGAEEEPASEHSLGSRFHRAEGEIMLFSDNEDLQNAVTRLDDAARKLKRATDEVACDGGDTDDPRFATALADHRTQLRAFAESAFAVLRSRSVL